MKTLVVFAACVALGHSLQDVLAGNACSFFDPVKVQFEICMSVVTSDSPLGGDTPIPFFRHMCSRKEAILDCMEGSAEDCDNKDTVMSEMTDFVNMWCDGNDIADWVIRDVAPIFDMVERDCIRALDLGTNVVGECYNDSVAASWIRNINNDINASTEAGIRIRRMTKDIRFGCSKRVIQRAFSRYQGSSCETTTWQAVYNMFVLDRTQAVFHSWLGLERTDLVCLERAGNEQQPRQVNFPIVWHFPVVKHSPVVWHSSSP